MDKLRKIGTWFWYNKERMVLLVMVVVLAYRVYGVVYPGAPPVWPHIPVPQTALPENAEERQTLGLPGELPLPPLAGLPGVYTSLYQRNPFWYYSGQGQQQDSGEVSAEDLNIQLVDIQSASTGPRARLRTIRTTDWYSEREQFEEFELVSIDMETRTVVVYSERYGRQFTLQQQ